MESDPIDLTPISAAGLAHVSKNYVTLARKSCNDSHVGVIQQPD